MIDADTPRNLLLRKLQEDQAKKVLAVAELVHLDVRDNVIEPNQPIQFLDFPETAVPWETLFNDDDNAFNEASCSLH